MLEELLGRPVKAAALSKVLVEAFKTTFGVMAEEGRLSGPEEALFQDLKTRKYQSREWNFDRIDTTTVRHDYTHRAALVGQ